MTFPRLVARLLVLSAIAGLLAACQTTATSQQDPALLHLLQLQKQRLDVAPLVARSKWNSGSPIDDPVREAQVLELVTRQAVALGLDADWSRHFFQDQFDAGKILQRSLHAQWRAQHLPPFTVVPDLGREVRPILDQLTPQLLQALRDIQAERCRPAIEAQIDTMGQQVFGDTPVDARERALAALHCAQY
jgi:chorismate mutase